jgi:hypothetical protein
LSAGGGPGFATCDRGILASIAGRLLRDSLESAGNQWRRAGEGIELNARALLTDVVTKLHDIPPTLSGDDSVLADTWEEIKYQVKAELSFIRLGYLDTINGVIDSAS